LLSKKVEGLGYLGKIKIPHKRMLYKYGKQIHGCHNLRLFFVVNKPFSNT